MSEDNSGNNWLFRVLLGTIALFFFIANGSPSIPYGCHTGDCSADFL